MPHKEYKIGINASKERVWFALWDPYHYSKWNSVFCEGSYAITNHWEQGSRVHFLSPQGNGMYSTVTENKMPEKMSFTHIGKLKDFQEMPLDDEAKKWTGGQEKYLLSHDNGITTLTVRVDVFDMFIDFFDASFPKALDLVKQLSEDFKITVETSVNRNIQACWNAWNNPSDIIRWNSASQDWHTTKAENDLAIGGKLFYRMEAKDGSMGFDFVAYYTSISLHRSIAYSMADGRKASLEFNADGNGTSLTECFEPEGDNPFDLQRQGWQSILNNFKTYVERDYPKTTN